MPFPGLCTLLAVEALPVAAVTKGHIYAGGQNPNVQEQHQMIASAMQCEPHSPGEHVLHEQGYKAIAKHDPFHIHRLLAIIYGCYS